jgi:hypothetical protein
MNRNSFFAGLAAALFFAAPVQAAEIQNVAVTAVSSQFASVANSTPELCLATNVVGNAGLYGDIHTYIRGGDMWLTASNLANASGTNAYITFDLGAVHTLDAMKVWNYNGHASSSPTSALATNLGVQLANISYSTDGLAFTTNLTGQVFNPAPGNFSAFAQSIPLGGISARYVRIDVLTNWATANSQVGLSKVRFIDDSVAPTVTAATENYGSNQVTITFSEAIDPQTATNPANYAVQSGANTAVILNAALGEFNNQIVLQTTLLTNQTYSLTAAGIYDEALTAPIANTNLLIQSELVLWLRADTGTVLNENGSVTNWLDQSGYGHNALTTIVNQYSTPPTLAPSTLNGLPVVNFSGNQLLAVPNDANLAINGDMTLCLVLNRTVSGVVDPISKTGGQGLPYTGTPLHGYTNNLPGPFDMQLASSTGKPVLVWGNSAGGAPTTFSSSGGLSVGQYYIVTMVVKGATNISSYLNGSFNGATILPYAAVDAGNPLMLGVRSDSGNASDAGAQFTGNLAEAMLIRGAITPGDLTAMNNYLGAKYNIPVVSLAITEEPQNATAQMGKKATFWIGAAGVPPLTYQWKTNNVNITGATSAIYTTPALTAAYNGLNYSVTITSPVGSTNSTAATLTVVNDTTSPTIFSAAKTAGLTNIVVTFSEAVASDTALNPANYSLNNGITVVSAAYGSSASNSVVLTVATLDPNAGYYLNVQNIQDLFGNAMTGASVPVLPAGLSLYLRGDSGVGLDDNGLVDQWLDQTTNANNTVQYTGGPTARPTTGGTINGVAALNFNSNSSNYLQAATSPTLALTGDMSLYAVANIADYTAPREILGKTSVAQPAPFDYYAANATTLRFYRGNGSVNALAVATQAPSAGIPHVLSVTMAGTNASQYLDGNANGSSALSTTIGDGGTPLYVGSRNDLSQFMNGTMAEVMLFNGALSAADRTNVDNYLGVKYFTFAINQPPQNVTTNEGSAVTFSVAASQGSAHLAYQWQENSTNLPGATSAAYTTPPLAPNDNGDTFAVVIMVPGVSTNVSSPATVTVNNVPPTILSAGEPIWSQTNIVVTFSEAVDPASATALANYSLNNGATILSAAIGDVPNKVVLTTTTQVSGTVYTLDVQNVGDLYGNILSPASPSVGIYPAATALWIKADSGVTTDVNGVSQWNDLSGNGNNLSQSFGPPYEPQLVPNAINGLPVIRFAATNQTYMVANSSPSLAINGDMAVFAVMNFATLTGNTNGMIVSKAAGSLPAPYDYYVRPGQVQFYRGNGTTYGLMNSTGAPTVGIPQLLDVVMQGTAVTQRLNGRANGAGTISAAIGDTGEPLSIGMRDDGADFLTGDMAELIVIGSGVSSNDVAALENYLATKYNFPVGLQSRPVITLQPVAVTNVIQDTTLAIPAAGAGNPAVSFQWYDTNNVALPGQTNATLVISNILVSDSYYLTVSNIFGSINSSVAAVNVVTVNTSPTNLTVSVTGNQLTLSWPADHTGWTLQAQTNGLGVGLTTNWFEVSGSASANSVVIPVDPTNGSVFYRLVYP